MSVVELNSGQNSKKWYLQRFVPNTRWLIVPQIVGTLALTLVVLNSVDSAAFVRLLSQTRPDLVCLATVCLVVTHLLNIARWQLLVKHSTLSYRRLTGIYGAGLFANNFLPTGIGGDGVRAAILARTVPVTRSISSVAIDRVVGLCALSVPIAVGMVLGVPAGWAPHRMVFPHQYTGGRMFWMALLGFLGLCVLGIALFRAPHGSRLDAQWHQLTRVMNRVLARICSWKRAVAAGYGISVIAHLGIIGATWASLHALYIPVQMSAAIWLVILTAVSSLLPVSLNGIGLHEGVYVMVLAQYGLPATDGLAAALLMRLLGLGFSLIGGLLSVALIVSPYSAQPKDVPTFDEQHAVGISSS